LQFDGGALHPLVRALPALVVLPLAAVPGLSVALELLFAESDQVRCGRRLLADRLFEVVLIKLLRHLLDHPHEAGIDPGLIAGLSDPRIARALTAIHERPGDPWTLERLAATAGMSRTVFAASFRETVGQTPADYVADWRMALAKAALLQGRPVKALAQELGYASPSALSRVFSARAGRSVREWLREVRPGGGG
jgi:AraC-like DNA-binding protein